MRLEPRICYRLRIGSANLCGTKKSKSARNWTDFAAPNVPRLIYWLVLLPGEI